MPLDSPPWRPSPAGRGTTSRRCKRVIPNAWTTCRQRLCNCNGQASLLLRLPLILPRLPFVLQGPWMAHHSISWLVDGKEGLSRETIHSHINPLLIEARVMADISEFKLFGRRPTIGKLVPHFPSNCYYILRDKVRSPFQGKELWGTLDKPPKMRLISKAVGKLI